LIRLALGLVLGLLAGLCRAEDQKPVTLEAGTESIPLSGHVAELHDPTGELSLDDVRQPQRAAQFAITPRGTINHGLSAETWWYRLVLQAPADRNSATDWVFGVGIPTLDYVDIHVTRANGTTETTLAGDLRPPAPNLLSAAAFAIPLRITPGEEVTLHWRVQMTGRHQVLPNVWTHASYVAFIRDENRRAGAVYGILLLMAVYNLLIFIVIRDRAYAYFVLVLLAMTGAGFVLGGDARKWVAGIPGGLAAVNLSGSLWPSLVALPMTAFAREFLQTRVHAPRAHKLTHVLLVLAAGGAVAYPLLGFLDTLRLGVVVFLANQLGMLGIAIHLAIQGIRAARFYLIAWVTLFLALTLFALSTLGMLPAKLIFLLAPGLGICTAVMLLSLALADRLNTERRERERLARLKHFFAPQVAEAILEEGGQALLAPKRREITVLFTDLRGFTAFAAQSEPEDVVRVLREYHEAVAAAAEKHHGNVEQFAGDSVMVFFNAPVELPDHERCGVRLAFELREAFAALCQAWRKRGHDLGVGIGIASGYATVGAVGSKGRMGYSCTGTVTNLASRLCAQAQDGQVLIAKTFLNRVEDIVRAEDLGERELKGIPKPVPVCNLTQLSGAAATA
jgi:class 3 adenylate cyclase